MNGFCTYTIYVRVRAEDGGGDRPVPCGNARVGVVLGPGLSVVVCKRHAEVVAKALRRTPKEGTRLTLDTQGEMAAAGGDE